jgi:flagellar biosynthesis/type III secretory pathway protein FliH
MKPKDTDRAYANGVKDGFNAGLEKAKEMLSNSLEETNANEKYSLLGKAALTIFVSNIIVKLSNMESGDH